MFVLLIKLFDFIENNVNKNGNIHHQCDSLQRILYEFTKNFNFIIIISIPLLQVLEMLYSEINYKHSDKQKFNTFDVDICHKVTFS